MGKVNKGIKCSVSGCQAEAVRSIASGRVSEAGLKVEMKSKRTYLCEMHYREFKKARRESDRIERMRWKP